MERFEEQLEVIRTANHERRPCAMTTTDASALEREVVELHGVIEGWFAGTRPRTAESYAGFADLLTLDFTSVSPDGSSSSRDVVVSGLEAAPRRLSRHHRRDPPVQVHRHLGRAGSRSLRGVAVPPGSNERAREPGRHATRRGRASRMTVARPARDVASRCSAI
jgi:hypothetical protein